MFLLHHPRPLEIAVFLVRGVRERLLLGEGGEGNIIAEIRLQGDGMEARSNILGIDLPERGERIEHLGQLGEQRVHLCRRKMDAAEGSDMGKQLLIHHSEDVYVGLYKTLYN